MVLGGGVTQGVVGDAIENQREGKVSSVPGD